MSEPSLECTARIQAQALERGTWIVVLKADQVPHVALLQRGVCFSLEHDGNHRYPAQKLWRLIESRQIPTVLCRLTAQAEGSVAAFFEAFDRLEGDANCFLPVRDHCASWFPAAAACDFVFQLIPLLDSAGKIELAASVNLPGGSGSPYVFPQYDQTEIRARIAAVRRSVAGAGD
ncbi:MAG: hypothetical protein HOP15_10630 [Planctomycetes bacterium]|nr:hypothetical protein [Planctomycetota bacterium]